MLRISRSGPSGLLVRLSSGRRSVMAPMMGAPLGSPQLRPFMARWAKAMLRSKRFWRAFVRMASHVGRYPPALARPSLRPCAAARRLGARCPRRHLRRRRFPRDTARRGILKGRAAEAGNGPNASPAPPSPASPTSTPTRFSGRWRGSPSAAARPTGSGLGASACTPSSRIFPPTTSKSSPRSSTARCCATGTRRWPSSTTCATTRRVGPTACRTRWRSGCTKRPRPPGSASRFCPRSTGWPTSGRTRRSRSNAGSSRRSTRSSPTAPRSGGRSRGTATAGLA